MLQMPTSSNDHHFQKEKQLLLEEIKSLVNRCMKRFVNRYELGTDNDPLIIDLCSCLEQIFSHGLKKTNSSLTRNKLLGHILPKNELFFWNFIVLFLNDHEIEHFSSLRNVHTDLGRGRSWIRNCLNEHSLHKYFQMILEDKSAHRQNSYHDWALLLDDKSSELPSIFENLNSILFALTIDTSDLDVPTSDPVNSKSNTQKSDNLAPIRKNDQNILVESANKKSNMIIIEDDLSDDIYAKSAPNAFTIESFGTNFAEDNLSTSAFSANEQSSLRLYPIENEQVFHKQQEEEEEAGKVENELLMETIDELQRSKDKLSRENILLNIKLKKYLATIELLKHDRNKRNNDDNVADGGGGGGQQEPENSVSNINAEIESYEQKLVQISEMHGEIVEFNEHLYKIIQIKDSIIARLRDELVELRGPLPDNEETMSIESSEIETNTHSLQLLPQPLIHIWIPTAFLSGGFKGKSHHIYQIYVRIKEEEWNVYRRYSQFYSLNKLLKTQYPNTSRYEFPPKKAIGNKDSRVVQERRKKLETYLRSVINHIQTQNTEIINKEKFISILPFLSDKYFLQDRSQSESNLNDARMNQREQQRQQSHSRNYMGF